SADYLNHEDQFGEGLPEIEQSELSLISTPAEPASISKAEIVSSASRLIFIVIEFQLFIFISFYGLSLPTNRFFPSKKPMARATFR
ncbi:hypothetical protein PSZ67_23910, partial [Shigella sonnei]|nr:hypothetical protein [Shigella sonnei]